MTLRLLKRCVLALVVPYEGAAPAQTDLLAGHIGLMFSEMSGMPLVKSGKLRARTT